jgi:uncharacterized surface protein with fasciclin (FAS1) repeats
MRLLALIPIAALTAAFVLPDEEVMSQIAIESRPKSLLDQLQEHAQTVWSEVEDAFKDSVAFGSNAIDSALDAVSDSTEAVVDYTTMTAFDTKAWLDSAVDEADLQFEFDSLDTGKKPHKKHPHHQSNKTVYELIAGSKYTTKLVAAINEFPDLVEALNGTAANYTVFAPTNKAFEKLPCDFKPTKEILHKIIAYHVAPDSYPFKKLITSHTIPTALGEDSLGGEPQRLRLGFNLLSGIKVNFYTRIIAGNIVRLSCIAPLLLRYLTKLSSHRTVSSTE